MPLYLNMEVPVWHNLISSSCDLFAFLPPGNNGVRFTAGDTGQLNITTFSDLEFTSRGNNDGGLLLCEKKDIFL